MLLRPLFLLCLATVTTVHAEISFSRQIAPLLAEKCVECHREAKSKGSYRLDTFEQLHKAGDSGASPLTPGKPEASELFRLLVTEDDADRMPKKADPLSREEITLVKQWIAEGGKFDGQDPRQWLAELGADRLLVASPAKYPRPLPITALAARPDGKQLAVSGYGEVLLWELQGLARPAPGSTNPSPPFGARLQARLQHLPERLYALAWVPQTSLLAVAGGTPGRGGEVWLVDTAQGRSRKRLLTTPDTVLCLAISADGKALAVGGTDNRIRLYELPEGKKRWEIEAHADWVMALAFSPDGQSLASASRDRTARWLELTKGEIVATHTGHETAVLSATFDPEGKRVITGSADGQLRIWNREGNSEKGTGTRPTREGVLQLLIANHHLLAALADKGVVELDLASKKTLHNFPGEARIDVLTVLPEPPTLITGAHNGKVQLWDLTNAQARGAFVAAP